MVGPLPEEVRKSFLNLSDDDVEDFSQFLSNISGESTSDPTLEALRSMLTQEDRSQLKELCSNAPSLKKSLEEIGKSDECSMM